jgi:hypothetical protein
MNRLIVIATGLLLATSALAGQPASQPGGTQTASVASVAAAPDRVYPPLPTLAMLPPAIDDDGDAAPRPTARKKKLHAPERRFAAPPARLVVSDASRAYLGGIEKQLDLALDYCSAR